MAEKKPVDWERIELDYRAGILTLRELSEKSGVSHVSIHKRAKRDGWTRDLAAKIQAKAEELVNRAEANRLGNKEAAVNERQVIDAGAEVILTIKMGHRKDIARARNLANKLLDELDTLTDEQGSIKTLIQAFKEGEHEDGDAMADMLALANKIGALPSRSKVLKEMSETLKNLVTLERDAYDIVTASKVDLNVKGQTMTSHSDFYSDEVDAEA
uniref:Terminase small subunit n=4 Tax=unclassified bacterial viruses TaxID=12333 RepID=A0AAU6W304_9VIRU